MFLTNFGWDDFFESQVLTLSSKTLLVGRVINEEKNLYRIQTDKEQIVWAGVPGKMMYESHGRADFPAVGDWVVVDLQPGADRGMIRHIYQRKNALQRKKVGEVSEIQILATNVDYVLVATSLNGDMNMGRLERYMTFAWDSGATPVILLTKADLVEGPEKILAEVEERFPGVNAHLLRHDDFTNADFLKRYLARGKTSVLVGSSGVGKSTLANYLIGEEVILVKEIREDDHKGRHTTTARSLYVSRFGGLIIDTPGMRELQFSDHQEGFEQQFGDIEELITNCRFGNCQHQSETGCAVLEALENGQLLPARWKSFNKIQREIKHEARKHNKWMMSEERKIWKKRSIESRQKYKGWQ